MRESQSSSINSSTWHRPMVSRSFHIVSSGKSSGDMLPRIASTCGRGRTGSRQATMPNNEWVNVHATLLMHRCSKNEIAHLCQQFRRASVVVDLHRQREQRLDPRTPHFNFVVSVAHQRDYRIHSIQNQVCCGVTSNSRCRKPSHCSSQRTRRPRLVLLGHDKCTTTTPSRILRDTSLGTPGTSS